MAKASPIRVYPVMFIDAIVFYVRKNNVTSKQAAHIILGVSECDRCPWPQLKILDVGHHGKPSQKHNLYKAFGVCYYYIYGITACPVSRCSGGYLACGGCESALRGQ